MEDLSQVKHSKAVFHIHAVTKIYRVGEVEVRALNGVDLDLFQGEFVVLLGPSGSGKSTLLNILGGLDVPTTGEVYYFDHNLSIYNDKALTRFRREHVGFVFQFYNLIPSLTALENVALVAEIAENPMEAEEALNLFQHKNPCPVGRVRGQWLCHLNDSFVITKAKLSPQQSKGETNESISKVITNDMVLPISYRMDSKVPVQDTVGRHRTRS